MWGNIKVTVVVRFITIYFFPAEFRSWVFFIVQRNLIPLKEIVLKVDWHWLSVLVYFICLRYILSIVWLLDSRICSLPDCLLLLLRLHCFLLLLLKLFLFLCWLVMGGVYEIINIAVFITYCWLIRGPPPLIIYYKLIFMNSSF